MICPEEKNSSPLPNMSSRDKLSPEPVDKVSPSDDSRPLLNSFSARDKASGSEILESNDRLPQSQPPRQVAARHVFASDGRKKVKGRCFACGQIADLDCRCFQ